MRTKSELIDLFSILRSVHIQGHNKTERDLQDFLNTKSITDCEDATIQEFVIICLEVIQREIAVNPDIL